MRTAERTRQQIDPVGTLGNRLLSVSLATAAFLYGLIATFRTLDQVSYVALAVLALLLLAAASLTVTLGTAPARAPVTRSTHMTVHLLTLGAIVLSAASQWGTNQFVQDDYGSLSLGLLMLALGPYRPAQELAVTGTLSAVFIGFVTLLEVPDFHSSAPPVSHVLAAIAPILALSYASASYSGSLVVSLERWQREVGEQIEARISRLREGITRAVEEDRILVLGHEALPFLRRVLEQDALEQEDRDRAREISDALRSVMVAEADRTWLEVTASDEGVPEEFMGRIVVDPAGRASAMVAEQRTALRALIAALVREPGFVEGSMTMEITGEGAECHAVLSARFGADVDRARTAAAPYFAVMWIVYSDFRVEHTPSTLTLRFSYEQR